jgi:hypothetical protein
LGAIRSDAHVKDRRRAVVPHQDEPVGRRRDAQGQRGDDIGRRRGFDDEVRTSQHYNRSLDAQVAPMNEKPRKREVGIRALNFDL